MSKELESILEMPRDNAVPQIAPQPIDLSNFFKKTFAPFSPEWLRELLLKTGKRTPKAYKEFQKSTPISKEKAQEIYNDYEKLNKPSLMKNLTLETIQERSQKFYWKILDDAENTIKTMGKKGEKNIKKHFIIGKLLFEALNGYTQPTETLSWLALNFEIESAREIFPGFISEYMRRFTCNNPSKYGFDKLQHFLWGAALTYEYGSTGSHICGIIREIEDAIRAVIYNKKDYSLEDSKYDYLADKDGIDFVKTLKKNKAD